MIVLIIAAVVFVVVEGALVYAVFKFRAKKHPVAAQIHGNTRLEIGWTVAAALILLILAVVTFIKLPSIVNPPNSQTRRLRAVGLGDRAQPAQRQEARRLRPGPPVHLALHLRQRLPATTRSPPSCPYSYTTMVVPVHTTVVLAIQSLDVIHSWWIPSLGGKVDAVPGYTTYTWFKATAHRQRTAASARSCAAGNHAAMDRLRRRGLAGAVPGIPGAEQTSVITATRTAQVSQLRQHPDLRRNQLGS